MTELEKAQASLAAYTALDANYPLITLGRLEAWPTRTQGTQLVVVMPDRRIQHCGVLWGQTQPGALL